MSGRTRKISTDSESSNYFDCPKRLKKLASSVEFPDGSNILHQFVLQNSYPNSSASEGYIGAVLRSMSDLPEDIVNAQINDDDEHTALSLAVLKNNLLMVDKLLSCFSNIDVNARVHRLSRTALHIAAKLGRLSIVRALLQKGAGIDIKDVKGHTALCYAAKSNHLDVVRLLVMKGADVNTVCEPASALCHAAKSGNVKVVKFLLRNGAVMNAEYRISVLFLAVQSGSLATVELLLQMGADVNSRLSNGITPLHEAALCGSLDVVKYLVSKGADVNAKYNSTRTPLNIAIGRGSLEIVAFLMDEDVEMEAVIEGRSYLHMAVLVKNLEIVRLLINKGADLDAQDYRRRTPLHYALSSGNLECVSLLLSEGADWRITDKYGANSLLFAVCGGSIECVLLLLDRGAKFEADYDGQTPLHVAASYGEVAMLQFLLKKGANRDVVDNKGNTPLDSARESRHQSCIDALQDFE